MLPGLILRNANSDDCSAIAKMESEIFSDPWSEDIITSSLGNPLYTVLCVQDADAVIGYIIGISTCGESEVLRIAVSPEKRSCGIGGALLDGFLELRRGEKDFSVFLEVRASNEAAQKLYLSRSFTICGKRKGYYKSPLEDAVLMSLDLDI